jgi:hypothetical protein
VCRELDTRDVFTAYQPQAAIGLASLSLYGSPATSQTQVATVTEHVYAWYFRWYDQGSSTRSYNLTPGGWRTVSDPARNPPSSAGSSPRTRTCTWLSSP